MTTPEHTSTGLSVAKTEELLREKRMDHDAVPVSAEEFATPRTDAEVLDPVAIICDPDWDGVPVVEAEFAKELERELSAARAELARENAAKEEILRDLRERSALCCEAIAQMYGSEAARSCAIHVRAVALYREAK